MTRRELALPVLVGLAAAAAAFLALDPDAGLGLAAARDEGPKATCDAVPPETWPVPITGESGDVVLAGVPDGPAGCPRTAADDLAGITGLAWLTPNVAAQPAIHVHGACPERCADGPLPPLACEPGCPRFGRDAWSVQATVYVFDGKGRLVASSDAPERADRFLQDGFLELPAGLWHLGDGPAPAGSTPVPEGSRAILQPVVDAMQGAGPGSLRSAVLDHPRVVELYGGPLYATWRVDAVA